MSNIIKKYLVKYKAAYSYNVRNAEREHIIFSCNRQQAIYDTIQTLTYFNNGKPVEIIDCIEIL